MRWVIAAVLVAGSACAKTIPPRALDVHIAARPHAPGGSGVAVLYDPRVCSFALRDARGVRTIAMPDHVFTWFTNGNTLLAVTPLEPGHYTLAAVTSAASAGPVEQDGHTYGYTDCTRHLATRTLAVGFEVVAGRVTLLALPGGTPSLKDVDEIGGATSYPTVHAREAAWLPSVEAARAAMRRKLVAALREPRDGYDVYPNCGLFGSGTAVVREKGTPFSFYAHPDDTAAFDRFRGPALAHVFVPSMHASGLGFACVERMSLMVMISNPAELDEVVRKAGEWLVHDDLQGEIVIEVEPVPHLL